MTGAWSEGNNLELEEEVIAVRYFGDDLPELFWRDHVSDWVDLYTAEDAELRAGEYRRIPLGVAMALPEGYEALVAPRSSTFGRYGVLQANSIGVVDHAYRGDGDQWYFPAYATRDVSIPKGTRLCQFRILRNQPRLRFVKTDHLPDPDRGGFGSTGR